MGKIVLLLRIALALCVAQGARAYASDVHAKHHVRRHDRIYGYVGADPEYCSSKVKDSPSCVAERARNATLTAQEEAEATASALIPSIRAEEACAQAKAPDVNACANHILIGWPQAHHSVGMLNIESYCRKIGDDAGGSNEMELTCRDEEFEAKRWAERHDTPQRTYNYCFGMGRDAGGSYVMYQTCVEQEEAAGSKL